MPCTTAMSFDAAAWIKYAPMPFKVNARSTIADAANSEAIVKPTTVVIGIDALRNTCRRMISRIGIPRLVAVCTCSRRSSSRTDVRVTRATRATAENANATAGSVRCLTWSKAPSPVPSAGNQPSWTANTDSNTIAATNVGTAAPIVVTTITTVSANPRLRPPSTPSPIPTMTIRIDA